MIKTFGYTVMLLNLILAAWHGVDGQTNKAILDVLFAIFISTEMQNE